MTSTTDGPKTLPDAIDAVEETYEFMLAYAAQGRSREEPGDDIRDCLGRADAGLAFTRRPLTGRPNTGARSSSTRPFSTSPSGTWRSSSP